MTDQPSERNQPANSPSATTSEAEPLALAPTENPDQGAPETGAPVEISPTGPRLVPVNEAIRYRRRAQQAEATLRQFEQNLEETQSQLSERLEQLATAEAQRDELRHQIDTLALRSSAERMLHETGVSDVETAMALLEKRTVFTEDPDEKALRRAVDQLLQDKPLLLASAPSLPGRTSSPRLGSISKAARLAVSAERAASTGNRRDVAEYLRRRRQECTEY